MGLDISFYKLKSRSRAKRYIKNHIKDIDFSYGVLSTKLIHDFANNQLSAMLYFRKVNFIFAFFEQDLYESQLAILNKEDLERLLKATEEVIKNPSKASELLPTAPGFFFGNTEYNEHYYERVKEVNRDLKMIMHRIKEDDIIYLDCDW